MITRYFFKRDNKNKIRIVQLNLEAKSQKKSEFTITGETGLLEGKRTPRPTILISKGKVKRTVAEQATLQYNSICSNYLDKGYKESSLLGIVDITDIKEIDEKLPKDLTDAKGHMKPMLAKSIDSLPESKQSILNNEWFGSKKIDGVRALLFVKDGIIQTSSRGGQNYNIAAHYIISDPFVQLLFKLHPNYILDGEIYVHGKPLSYISGLCRLETLGEQHKQLTFQCYDIVREDLPFWQRKNILESIEHDRPIDSKLEIVYHSIVQGKSQIIELHNKYVADGYEGLVIRDPNEKYKCGARDNRMLKVKMFQDAEFEILGLVDGLRDEDLCFSLKTKEGYVFKAKPIGDRTLKQWYREHISDLVGKMGTVKYFGLTTTETPVPFLPVFKSVRLEEDI